jgi:hypothetical protein
MKTKKFLFYLLAVLLGGCVASLHPLFTEKDFIFEKELLGVWADNSQETWRFKRYSNENDKRYEMIYTDKDGKEGRFIACLGKLNDMMFLDLFPKDPNLQANDFYKLHLLPVHTFMKIEQIEPTLKMRMMDPEKMEDMLKNDPNLIKHEIVENRIVLTASTQQLQQFIKDHANDEGFFNNASDMKRLDPNCITPNKQ